VREVRNALAIGPRNAIDQFGNGNSVPQAADVRGGIKDDRAGSHTPVCSRADHGTDGLHGIAQTNSGHERVKSYIAVATDED
jgi:hypothetical protein